LSNSICKAFKSNKSDERYTPKILVDAIEPYFRKWLSKFSKKVTVWCPFDKDRSEFVFFFKEKFPEVCVVFSHLDYGQDFFEYEPDKWDIAISNPPFSRKLDVFKRLDSLGKPWVMLCNIMCLNYMEIGNYFVDNQLQLLLVDKRVSFDGRPSSFNSSYFCNQFLERDLTFCSVKHCNMGKNFIPSRMY